MKYTTVVQFEDNNDLEKSLHVSLIAQTFCRSESYNTLYFSQKRRLLEAGITEEIFKSYVPLIQKAKRWEFQTGLPQANWVTNEEYLRWQELKKIALIVCGV